MRPPRAPHQPTSVFDEAQRSNRDRWRPLRFNWQVNSCVCHSGGRRHQTYIAAPGVDARCCLLLRSCLHLASHVDWGRVLALTCLLSSNRRETGHSCVSLPRCPLPSLLASRTKRASNHHASGRLTPEASHRLFHLTQLLCTADRNPHRWCFDACRFNLSNISATRYLGVSFGLPACRLPLPGLLPNSVHYGHTAAPAPAKVAAADDAGAASLDAVVSKYQDPVSRAASLQEPSEWSFAGRQSFGVPGRRSFERCQGGVAAALAEQRQRRQRRCAYLIDASFQS